MIKYSILDTLLAIQTAVEFVATDRHQNGYAWSMQEQLSVCVCVFDTLMSQTIKCWADRDAVQDVDYGGPKTMY